MTSDRQAPTDIDRLLTAAGGSVQNAASAATGAARGVALREFPRKYSFASKATFHARLAQFAVKYSIKRMILRLWRQVIVAVECAAVTIPLRCQAVIGNG